MDNLFGFLMMMGSDDYEQRKVARFDSDTTMVSTALTSDTGKYETAVRDPRWNNNEIVIVETYETRGAAEEGHEKWVALVTGPEQFGSLDLKDCSEAPIAQLLDAMYGTEWRKKKRTTT